jgi:Zn finger protein HypA/HybF involved in hydrogenase expression
MLEQELSMECPFCEKVKIKVRHIPSVKSRSKSTTRTMGSRTNFHVSKEVYDVMEDCPNCHKTKEEIQKRLIEGKPMDRNAILKRMRDMGLDPAKVRL